MKGFVSQNPGHLSEQSLARIQEELKRRGLDDLDMRKKPTATLAQIMSAVRHRVYDLGLMGGNEKIWTQAKTTAIAEQNALGMADPVHQETAEQFAERMRKWRTLYSIDGLASLGPIQKAIYLGTIRARYSEPNEALALSFFNADQTAMERLVSESTTPTDAMLSIIELAEKPAYSEKEVLQRAALAAKEFMLRSFVTTCPELIKVASRFFRKRHFDAVLEQMPDSLADGRIGGKSAGMLLAYAALEEDTPDFDQEFAEQHRMDAAELHPKIDLKNILKQNASRFIGSRVFEKVLRHNSELAKTSIVKTYYINGGEAPDELHQLTELSMMHAEFPKEPDEPIERQLKTLFLELHGKPIIIRSSSELEDRIGAAFAGKYKSIELSNCGDDAKDDFEKFKAAILEVYASAFSKDVMEYRAKQGLLIEDEEMGILVQTLNGNRHGDYFHPDFAGVAMSHATQSHGEDPSRGAMTIVAGLGEQAVTKGGKFAMFAKPNAAHIKLRLQTRMTVMDLRGQKKDNVRTDELSKQENFAPGVKMYGLNQDNLVDCEGLLKFTDIPLTLEYVVQKLKHQLGYDVDCEFTIQYEKRDGEEEKLFINVVQCRPQAIPENLKASRMPDGVPQKRILMAGDGALNATHYTNITHLVYIDPDIFEKCGADVRAQLRCYVNKINKQLSGKRGQYLIISSRRWGTMDEPKAGIPAQFSDFSNAAGVMEVFDGKEECSWGTHFLQDLMEADMATGSFSNDQVNHDFLRGSAHCPDFPEVPAELKPYLKVINVNEAYEKASGEHAGKGWAVHIAQNNRGAEEKDRLSRVYMAEKDCDLPVAVI